MIWCCRGGEKVMKIIDVNESNKKIIITIISWPKGITKTAIKIQFLDIFYMLLLTIVGGEVSLIKL